MTSTKLYRNRRKYSRRRQHSNTLNSLKVFYDFSKDVAQFTGRKPNAKTLRRDYFDSLNEIQNYKFYFNTEYDEILSVTNIKNPYRIEIKG